MVTPGPSHNLSNPLPGLDANPRSRHWIRLGMLVALVGLLVGIAVVILAVFVDGPVAAWVNGQGIAASFRRRDSWARTLSEIMKTPGEWYYACAIAAACLLDPRRHRAALFLLLAMVSSMSNVVVKWIVGRQRPWRNGPDGVEAFHTDFLTFHFFRDGLQGFFFQSNLSFPSGHACQAFAVSTALVLLYPKWGWLAMFPAMVTACERVLSNSHYVSEVFFGGVLGAAGVLSVSVALQHWATGWHPSHFPPRIPTPPTNA